jgi:hypothetical protein
VVEGGVVDVVAEVLAVAANSHSASVGNLRPAQAQ